MSAFRHVIAWVTDNPHHEREAWPRCYYEQARFCGQDATICECPSCPVKCQADSAAYAAKKRIEEAEARRG